MGLSIFIYIYHKDQPNVGKYYIQIYMDPIVAELKHNLHRMAYGVSIWDTNWTETYLSQAIWRVAVSHHIEHNSCDQFPADHSEGLVKC